MGYMNRFYGTVSKVVGGLVFTVLVLGFVADFVMPFLPIIAVVAGALITGLLIRLIFVRIVNKRLHPDYRYGTSQPRSHRNANPRQDKTADAPAGHSREKVETRESKSAYREKIDPPPEPESAPDSLLLYRNLLGLKIGFTAPELKAAYRNAAALYHPDRYAASSAHERKNAEDLMKQVNEAYERLKAATGGLA